MTEYRGAVTSKGQATVPIEVRRLLGLKPHDRVAFIVRMVASGSSEPAA